MTDAWPDEAPVQQHDEPSLAGDAATGLVAGGIVGALLGPGHRLASEILGGLAGWLAVRLRHRRVRKHEERLADRTPMPGTVNGHVITVTRRPAKPTERRAPTDRFTWDAFVDGEIVASAEPGARIAWQAGADYARSMGRRR